jgi:peptide/nickel transport system permease protein
MTAAPVSAPAEPTTAARPAASAGPWRLAMTQLLANRWAMVSAVVFILIVAACMAAPLYAHDIAHTNPFQANITGTTIVDGRKVSVLQQSTTGLGLGVTPIGPTWDPAHYFLGADGQGRDVMARLLYGGRNTLYIGLVSAVLTCVFGAVLGIVSGYLGGVVDAVIARVLDVIWAFPVYLLAICLSVVLLTSGLDLGIVHVGAGSLLLPLLIIAVIYVPYVARPVRGEVKAIREKEFIQSGIATGACDLRIMRRDVLPNVLPTVVVFLPLMASINMLTESALSFLSVGVQPPDASWGPIVQDGLGLIYTRPMVAIAPGLALALTAVALNILGDGVRDALDPAARIRGGA